MLIIVTNWQAYIPLLAAVIAAVLQSLRNGATVSATERKVDAVANSTAIHQPTVETRLTNLEAAVADVRAAVEDVRSTVQASHPSAPASPENAPKGP